MPRPGDPPDRSAEHPGQEAPAVELLLKLLLVQFSSPHPAEHPDDASHRDQVHQPYQDKKGSSHNAAD
jgi:hypothetical protein